MGLNQNVGASVYRTLGADSVNFIASKSKRHPSMKIPSQNAPSGGLVLKTVSSPFGMAWKSNTMESIGSLCFLAKFCNTPVRNACVKKNPVIQNVLGAPWSILRL